MFCFNLRLIKYIFLCFLLLVPSVVFASFKDQALDIIHRDAVRYDLPLADIQGVIDTMGCETANTWDPTIQSADHRPDGSRELSFGLSQIYLPMHPDISYASATDPIFAVEYMVKNFKLGHRSMWSCYKYIIDTTAERTPPADLYGPKNLDIKPLCYYTQPEIYGTV